MGQCRSRGGGGADKDAEVGEQWGEELNRCSASFAWLQLKFCCCNCCCLCCWVTGERQRWWCHGDGLACRAAAASFLNRSTFLRIVVKEMSSEQKPIWQLRVKWGEKSKSHSIWERLRGAYLQARSPTASLSPPPSPSLRLFPCGSTQDGHQSLLSEIKCYYWVHKSTHKHPACTHT